MNIYVFASQSGPTGRHSPKSVTQVFFSIKSVESSARVDLLGA